MGDSGDKINASAVVSTSDENVIKIEQLDDDVDEPSEKAPERDQWGSKVSYILALVGYAVGFGNIWRFPYQVRENGGLVFMVPYFFMLALLGIPIFFLELSVGQRRRKGVIYAWAEVSPRLGGIGIACGVLCFVEAMYYNTLLAYCFSYLFDSFRSPLPWSNCDTITKYSGVNEHAEECKNNVSGRATKYYWFRRTLDVSAEFDQPGNFSWYLFMYEIFAWIMICGILLKGTKSVGYVVYFTAVFPYVVLFIFFVSNFVIDRQKAWLGAYRLLKPDWKLLWSPTTWLKAGSQIFYSLSLAEGCLVVFASYNPARNNCYKDSIYISLVNCFSSIYAALVVFPMIGLLGHNKYDICVGEMRKIFTGSDILKSNKPLTYDIYYATEAKTWDEVSSTKKITIRYNYGEIIDEDIMTFPKDADTRFEYLDDNALSQAYRGKNIPIDLQNCSIGQEATASGGGTGFVFLAFTEAVLNMPGANFWAVLFFVMLLTLGVDSGFGLVEGIVAAIEDLTHIKRWKATTLACGTCAFASIITFPFGWGAHVLELMDQWTANWTLLTIAFLECIAVAWDHGLAKISYDIHLMTGSKPSLYILICWKYVSPSIIAIMLTASIVEYIIDFVKGDAIKFTSFDPKHPDSKDGDVDRKIPPHSLAVGFILMLLCIVWVPVHFFLRKTKYNLLKEQAPAEFPEEELREERNIHVEREEDQFTPAEKAIMGKSSIHSLQLHRDSKSQTSIITHASANSGNLPQEKTKTNKK